MRERDGAERPGPACNLSNEAPDLELRLASRWSPAGKACSRARLTCNQRSLSQEMTSPNSQLGTVGASHTSVSIADITKEEFLLCPCSCGALAFAGEVWIVLQTPLVVAKDQRNASIKGIVFSDFYGLVHSVGA